MLNYDTPSLFETLSDHSADQLEYASSVEHVQKFGLMVCHKDWHNSYVNLLNVTNIPTLYSIQETASQALSLSFPDSPAARRVSPYLSRIRTTNSATLSQIFAHPLCFKTPFFPSAVRKKLLTHI